MDEKKIDESEIPEELLEDVSGGEIDHSFRDKLKELTDALLQDDDASRKPLVAFSGNISDAVRPAGPGAFPGSHKIDTVKKV